MTKQIWIGIGVVAGLLILIFVGYEWLQEHDARLKAESVQTAQTQVIQTAQIQITEAKAAEAKAASDLQTQLAEIAMERKTVPTPQQVVVDVSKLLPSLPQPVQVQNVPATATAPATQQLVVPAADIPDFQNYKLDCDTKSAQLNACSLMAAEKQTEVNSGAAELKAMTAERDEWKTAAKGGTLLHRVFSAGKWIVIGGVIGYIAGRVVK